MLTRDEVIRLLQQEQPYLAAEFGVSRIGLFGSYAKGDPPEFHADPTSYTMFIEIDRLERIADRHISDFPKWKKPEERYLRGQLGLPKSKTCLQFENWLSWCDGVLTVEFRHVQHRCPVFR